ncbi:hypothetical protein J2Z31_004488 [Sinorhizobium kostiense]|uniref:Transposase n=1 Tax=Sinorhizobium kostiense TaxID=76747 RepID=A0ABS4R4Z3_9HYPH|nr:hypothetical protein [Sinorhizobium kostiense]
MAVTAQEDTEIVKRGYNARQLHAIDKENRQRNLLLADRIKKEILQILRTFRHRAASFLFAGSAPVHFCRILQFEASQ